MTAREPTPSAQFTAFLSRFPPEIVALVKRCLPKLRRTFPVFYEIVYDYTKSVVVSFSMSERGYEAIIAIAIFPDALRLYLDKSLPDPKGLLKGAGTKVRSVTIHSAKDLDHPDIQALFDAAIQHAGVTFPKTRSTQMIIKPESKKKQKPKPKKQSTKRTAPAEPGATTGRRGK